MILEVKVGEKVEAGACSAASTSPRKTASGSRRAGGRRLPHLRPAAGAARADPRSRRLDRSGSQYGPLHRPAGPGRQSWPSATCFRPTAGHPPAVAALGPRPAVRLRLPRPEDRFRPASSRPPASPSTRCSSTPRQAANSSSDRWAPKSGPFGVVFAFQVLPIVIFIASLFADPLLLRRHAGASSEAWPG